MKIRPIDDRLVVQVMEAEERTSGGIILPDAAREKPQRGKVTAVGEGALDKKGNRSKLSVRKGDTILFGKYSGTDVKVAGEEFKILRENEVLARLEE